MKVFYCCLLVGIFVGNSFAIDLGLNRTIHIQSGEFKSGGCATINGCIIIGEKCNIKGTCRSVNGMINIGSQSKVRKLQTVNGGIRINPHVRILDDIQSVNGPISCRIGVLVRGSVESVNGPIELLNTKVKTNVTTYNGNIKISDHSIVCGDIIIKKRKGCVNQEKPLKIEITDESIIEGDIIVEEKRIKVIVDIDKKSKVKGDIIRAKVRNEY